jgi:hypothetical protein
MLSLQKPRKRSDVTKPSFLIDGVWGRDYLEGCHGEELGKKM